MAGTIIFTTVDYRKVADKSRICIQAHRGLKPNNQAGQMHISLSRVEAWLLRKYGSGRSRVYALYTVHIKTAAIRVVSGKSKRVARRRLASLCIQAWQKYQWCI